MQKATLRKTNSDAASGAANTELIELPTQIMRTTSGEMAEIPLNGYNLYDTRTIDKITNDFFLPSPDGTRIKNNYDQMPPNPSEQTFIVGLGASFTKAFLKGSADVNAIDYVNRAQGGILQILRNDTQAVLVEEPLQRFLDLSGLQVNGDTIVLPTAAKPVALDEAVVIPTGIGYRMRVVLGDGAPLPTKAQWEASNVSVPEIRLTARHRGNNGR